MTTSAPTVLIPETATLFRIEARAAAQMSVHAGAVKARTVAAKAVQNG